ncbi:MAG: hypothetical protein J1F05_05165 [Muribaculaceae bacterium]|nr:hypothetical protein [Muribaculaceae bacterium]
MRIHIRHILSILMLLSMTGLVSCAGDDAPDNLSDGKRLFVIHLDVVSATRSDATAEMIDNLRIVMIDDDADTIEVNQLVTFDIPGGIPATNFPFDFTCYTNSGYKKFYLLANEDRIPSIMYSDGNTSLPANLTGLLESFQSGDRNIAKLEDALNSVCFSPQYAADNNGSIYLPYSSFYDNVFVSEIPEDGEGLRSTAEMFLVPVATKFSFNFTNYRDKAVDINGISIKNINSENYLFAQVGASDQKKTLPDVGGSLYWVDWLAEISRLSQQTPGFYPNLNFNDKYGWISDYSLPFETTTNIAKSYIFIGDDESFSVDGVLDGQTGEAGVYTAGPFYVPESKNFLNPVTNTSTTEQMYYLTILLKDTDDMKQAPDFTDVSIPNVKALFRNTNVIINVKMEQGDIEVYAQIAPWNQKSINGWVTEGNAPNPNPFSTETAHK